MNSIKNKDQERDLLVKLGGFSKNMVHNHHLENLSEFVMHDLCSEQTFNLSKAAYLVNNPDFACLKGVAGHQVTESFASSSGWNMPKDFTSHMKNAAFNQKVRSVSDRSVQLTDQAAQMAKIEELAQRFEMTHPLALVWTMKHDNQGIFLFEKPDHLEMIQDHLRDFLHMLSFCAIF